MRLPALGARSLLCALALWPMLLGCGVLEGDLAAGVVQLVASTEANFRKSRALSALVEPADLQLYRSLLPEGFEMPRHPMLSFAVVDQLEVGPWPLTPYQLGAVSLRCRFQGEEGWHPVTMPENAWVAVWTGRTMGFPKYLADEIRLSASGEAWVGVVRHEGEARLRLEFVPAESAAVPAWEREGWAMDGPTFNLRPPGEGPEVRVVRSAQEDPGDSELTRGLVRITIGPGEPWSGLLPPGSEAPGVLSLWEGGRSLAPE